MNHMPHDRPMLQIRNQKDLRKVRAQDPHFAGTLAKGLLILQTFVSDPRAHANSEFAQRLGGSRPTVSRLCKTLQAMGFLDHDERLDRYFIGPAAVFTNDHYPRSVSPDGSIKGGDDWEAVGVTCREGSSIGARAVCVAPVTIGRWALVAAGSVVIKDVPDFALVAGVPARRIGWVGRAGVPLEQGADGTWTCPQTGTTYTESDGQLMEHAHG